MKTYLTLFLAFGISLLGISQSVSNYNLNFNNTNATVNDGGVFLNDPQASQHGNEVPNGSQLHTIYSLGFWYGGLDVNGQLKLSAQSYAPLEDQFKGPLTNDGTAQPDNSGAWSTSIFPVTKADIDYHIANFMNSGYVPSANLMNWPAHGNISNNFEYYLAPFYDYDGDGSYHPDQGDYPCIQGDNAAYIIMNDKGGIHASGGDPIGLEMHYLFYEYTGIPEIENTTFVNGKIINRGTQTLYDFKMSAFIDADIGNPMDDYFGSDSIRNMMYFYNGDNFDETSGALQGYGENPPAAGIVSLTHDFESIGSFDNTPSNAPQYWNLMNAKDLSGAQWINPVTGGLTNFMFSGDPIDPTELNSEVALTNPTGERKGIANINLGTLLPSAVHDFDFAVIYNRDSLGYAYSASGLRNVADIVKAHFDTAFVTLCNTNSIGLEESVRQVFSIHPNPSDGQFTLAVDTDLSNVQAKITDLTGRVVMDVFNVTSAETQIQVNEPAGVYFLQLSVDGRESVKRIVLK